MITIAILLNGIVINQKLDHAETLNRISEVQMDTQSKFNELTESLIKTQKKLENLNTEIGSIDEEFDLLKASVSEDFSGIVENSIKSVVTVKTDIGQGTGFLIEENGFLVTNAHVLSGGKYAQALTYQQKILNAELVGYNPEFDLALLKISGKYSPLKLEESKNIQAGEKVIAIGNPLGLQFSVSQGIISAVHRPGINNIEAYLQTDTALNPGNSGGPLIDKEGKVVGINNFKISGGESLGFALESDYIKKIVNEISQESLNITLI